MKKLILFLLVINLFSFEGALIKTGTKVFGKSTIKVVTEKYGSKGVVALDKLSVTYGKSALNKLDDIYRKFGQKGITILNRFGEKALKNKTTFEMVSKYQDKAIYMLKNYPQSEKYFAKYGDLFMKQANKYGDGRIIKYLDVAQKKGQTKEVLEFIQKGGVKAINFIERNWGKILVAGFVFGNSDKLIQSGENIVNHSIDAGKEMVLDSSLLNWIGFGVFLYILSLIIPSFIRRIKK